MRRWRGRRRAVFIAAIASVVALLLAASVVFADRTGLHCLAYGPKGPPTLADGPVAVHTDASVYATDGTIAFWATNKLDAPITLFVDALEPGTCRSVELERRTPAGWQATTLAYCFSPHFPVYYTGLPYRVPPGQELGDEVDLKAWSPRLQPGTYQVVMRYVPEAAVPPYTSPLPLYTMATRVPSAPFRVCTCAHCD